MKFWSKLATSNTSEKFLNEIRDHFRAKLRVLPRIEFCGKDEINALRFPVMSRKPVELIDHRSHSQKV